MGEVISEYKILIRKTKRKRPLGRYRCGLGVLKELVLRCGLNSSLSRHGPVVSSCEHNNEPFSSMKDGSFLDQLSDYLPYKEESAPWGYLVYGQFHQA
jgi:hypothetical protein